MYRCTCRCPTRALEAFIADFAGISIRTRPRLQRVQHPVRRLHSVAEAERPSDAVSLQPPASRESPGLSMSERPPALEIAPSKVEKEGESPTKSAANSAASPARSKAESRMLRKLKRIQNGTHNKSDQSAKLVGYAQQMLQKIEESPKTLKRLVGSKKEKETEATEKKPRRRRPVGGSVKWAKERQSRFKGKPAKVEKEGGKRQWAKARKQSSKDDTANEIVGEATVDVGEDAAWEHVQDEWTDEPKRVPKHHEETKEVRETTETKGAKKTTRKESRSSKLSDKGEMPAEDTVPARRQELWGIQKSALERKFGEKGWQPRKRLSPDTLSGIRALHASNPTIYNVDMLRDHFKITPEAIRRILKSKWKPSSEEIEDRMQRWERRGVRKWSEMAEQGQKPPKKWRELGVPNPKLGKRKAWDSNTGVAGGGTREKNTREKTAQEEEGLFGKARQMEHAQRMRFKESLAGRIL